MEPFGPEWRKEMGRHTKEELITYIRELCAKKETATMICPIMSKRSENEVGCQKEKCVWWNQSSCAIHQLSEMLIGIAHNGIHVTNNY